MVERSNFDVLSARIDRLERQSTVLKRLLLASFAAVFALLAGGATIAQQRQLSFSGSNGTVRVNSSGLSLYDKSGHQRMTLGWNSVNQPGLYYFDASGNSRIGLYLSDLVKPVMRMYDKTGAVRTEFSENTEGTNMIRFFDANHVERAYFGQSTADDPTVQLFDASHTLRSYMGAYTGGGYGFYINDSAGTTTWQSP
jgi:hypothetical protein